jgi:hypothetical protein
MAERYSAKASAPIRFRAVNTLRGYRSDWTPWRLRFATTTKPPQRRTLRYLDQK